MLEPSCPKVLVVFFSRTGVTRRLAECIARAAGGDLEELRERRSRKGVLGWLRSGYEGTYGRSAAALPLQHDLRNYDLVFVGSPTWNKALSSPVRGFLKQHRTELPCVALFATCEGDGAQAVIEQMTAFLPVPPLVTLTMLERDVKHNPAVAAGELTESAFCKLAAHQSDGATSNPHH